MGIFGDNQQNYEGVFPPKVGESEKYVIVGAVQRVKSNNEKICYKKPGVGGMGYYDKLPIIDNETGEETYLIINTWKLYFELRFENQEKKIERDLSEGDTIEINHKSREEYIVTKV